MSTGVYRTDNGLNKELREDLLDIITDLSPTMTPLYTGLQKSTAKQSFHSWVTDSVSRASATGAVAEGADVTFSDLASPTRVTNFVQEITEPYKVSQKMEDSDSAGMSSQLSYQRTKAMRRWKLKAEYSLLNGTGSSGLSGVAGEMKGLKAAITTNITSYTSGTSLTESAFNDILQLPFDNVEDDTYEVYTNIELKRAISGFTAGNTKNIQASDKRLINAVDVYESDAAKMVKIFAHRDLAVENGGYRIIAIQPKAFAVAHLHNPEDKDHPESGPYKAGYIYGSLTLEYRQEAAGAQGVNLVRAV